MFLKLIYYFEHEVIIPMCLQYYNIVAVLKVAISTCSWNEWTILKLVQIAVHKRTIFSTLTTLLSHTVNNKVVKAANYALIKLS